jgi:alpha-ribazole phosphatase
MNVLLMRHGKTAGNLLRRYIGRTDEPLCPEGVEHVIATGIDPTVKRVYVSPMRRAVETATIKFPNAQQIVINDLREMDFGDFEGLSADDMVENAAYRAWVESECHDECPNGESGAGFIERICHCFDELVRACIARGEKDLVIVAHGGTIMSILWKYAEERRNFYEWPVGNACFYRAALDEATWFEHPALYDVTYHEVLSANS